VDDDVRAFGTELGRKALGREWLGFDSFCEAWVAVVDTAEGLRVGYWSQGAY
jgi:hypothetical protein